MNPKISAFMIAKDEVLALPRAVTSIRDHVDEVVVALDDRTVDGTENWLLRNGVRYFRIGFKDFSQASNAAQAMTCNEWVFQIDADETMLPQHACRLREFAARGEADGVDLFRVARRHWLDLEMTKEHAAFYPDFQSRLKRRYVTNKWRVHQSAEGFNRQADTREIEIQHFNLFYGGLQKKADLYSSLMELDRKDGREI